MILATVGIYIHNLYVRTNIHATYMVVHVTDVGLIFFFTVCWMRTITLGIQLFILCISVFPQFALCNFHIYMYVWVCVCFSYFVPYACAFHSLPRSRQRRFTATWLIMYKCSYSRTTHTHMCTCSHFMLVGVLILITFLCFLFSTLQSHV